MTMLINSYRFAAAGGAFDPINDVSWFSAFWAEDPAWSNPGDGGSVSQWDDATGNGRHVTQGTGSAQPTYRSSVAALNSQPALQFDGGDYIDKTASFSMTQPNTVVIVADADGTGGPQTLVDSAVGSSNRHLVNARSGSATRNMHAGSSIGATASDTNPHLYIATYNGVSSSLVVDGITEASGNAGSQNLSTIRFGATTGGGANFLTGHIAFIGYYDGNLGSTERAALLSWSQSHYGTP